MIHVTIGHYVILPIVIFCHDHAKNSKTQSNLCQIYLFLSDGTEKGQGSVAKKPHRRRQVAEEDYECLY